MLSRNFWLLFANRALTRFAYHLTTFALIIWVFELTRLNIAVSLWFVVFFFASFFTAFLSGVAADLYDRRRIMVLANLAWAGGALLLIPVKESFGGLLAVSFLIQALDEFFYPAQTASLPQLVRSEDLIQANAWLSGVTYAVNFFGYLLAGILLRFWGFEGTFILAAGSVALGGMVTLALPPLMPNGEKHPTLRQFLGKIRGHLQEQVHYLSANRNITATALILSVVVSGAAAAGSIAPGFAEQVLKIQARDLSFVAILPLCLGFLVAAYTLSRSGKFFSVWGGFVGLGAILILLSFSPALRVLVADHVGRPQAFEQVPLFSLAVAFLTFWAGAFAATATIPVVTSLQRLVPAQNLGRTIAAMGMLSAILSTVFSLTFGVAADLFTPAVPVFIVGGLQVLAGIWARAKVVIK
ncbi:MAG: Glucose-dependent multidrug resistance protein (Multidrug-efflux transporter) [candidate division CPR1 bacterium GW2011_GWC1_49_13]|uniref:Glucose-dependent multidrug resistance protein (Multidrug-efflux transporter) n=1 Tax=candidate division CPR1 bacterium GW2011_GWC1_49_13 TaxID=1618342 RepID=A0A0G1VHI2_9BACT|nr:MAG: Glucose-dependent multidrug resistance protein (Multidrug-efflux transporter) [candidate division CPR1 bacterium GW2011_GWC1_49_13]